MYFLNFEIIWPLILYIFVFLFFLWIDLRVAGAVKSTCLSIASDDGSLFCVLEITRSS